VLLNAEVERTFGTLTVFALGQNLLGTRHDTFGILSGNVRGPDTDPQPFLSPGLPRRGQVGLRVRF
jgi:hypothetical protein